MFRLLALFGLLVASAAAAAAPGQCYTGYGYNADTNKLAFTARYVPTDDAQPRPEHWRVTYRDADNNIIATKQMDFTHNPFVPVFTLQFPDSPDTAGIQRDSRGDWRMFKRLGDDDRLASEDFTIKSLMASDNGIHPFIQAHFAQLMAREPVKFKLVVPPRQSVVKMRIDRIEDIKINGRRTVRFRIKVNSFFISWFTQKLIFTYRPDNKQLLAYSGVSDMQQNRGDPFPVRVRYFRESQPPDPRDLPDCSAGF